MTGCEVVEPVRFEADVVVRGGRIGPNVTLEAGTVVEDSSISHTVVGAGARLTRVELHDSIIGSEVDISDASGSMRVTDHSFVDGGSG